ncbi:MAG: GAF domain-containing SpoIIE family protein phosphatase [Phycisphaerales bacterium]|nr:SpoIIE family protein phosphatase [Planctomycetota bacterium]
MTVSDVNSAVKPPASGGGAEDAALAKGAQLSITDFLSDGSLVRLCAELSKLAGVRVDLLDARGRTVHMSATGWGVDETPATADAQGAACVPLMLESGRIGSFLVAPGRPAGNSRETLEQVVRLLSSTTAELCERELDLRHRVKEASALYRLSTMLPRATSVDRVLQVALELALDVLGLDCGGIVLVPEDTEEIAELRGASEEDLVLKASKGLSDEWLSDPRPLSKDRVFDRIAIGGELVVSEELATDPRVNEPDRVVKEGLVAAIHAGMAFQGRPIGVMRLYARGRRLFDESDKRVLRSIASQAATAVQQARLLKVQDEDQRLQRQLQLAADVQRRMLPRFVPAQTKDFKNFDIAAKYIPSFELGGDFYDFIGLTGHLGIVVGDVVGKGIAAALLMSAVRASLRAHAQGVYDLDEVISRVNVALCRDTLDNEFATLWYGVLDPIKLRLTYCSAGHEPPLIVRVPEHRAPGPAEIDELAVGGMVVGIDRSQRYQRAVYDMHSGDVLVAYTDGVIDTVNFDRQKFGKKRLRTCILEILKAKPKATASEIAEHIHWSLRQFAGLAPRPDDETIVVVRPWAQPHTPA